MVPLISLVYVLRGTTFRCAKRRRVIRDLPASGPLLMTYADVAQLAEQLICNQQVIGSSPIIGLCAGVAELADAQDLKSCGTNLPYRFDSGRRHESLV